MSVVKRTLDGPKVTLWKESSQLWQDIERHWAGHDQKRWKRLAILHLYVHCHWTMEMIGDAFGHPKGHISRVLRQIVNELDARFQL